MKRKFNVIFPHPLVASGYENSSLTGWTRESYCACTTQVWYVRVLPFKMIQVRVGSATQNPSSPSYLPSPSNTTMKTHTPTYWILDLTSLLYRCWVLFSIFILLRLSYIPLPATQYFTNCKYHLARPSSPTSLSSTFRRGRPEQLLTSCTFGRTIARQQCPYVR